MHVMVQNGVGQSVDGISVSNVMMRRNERWHDQISISIRVVLEFIISAAPKSGRSVSSTRARSQSSSVMGWSSRRELCTIELAMQSVISHRKGLVDVLEARRDFSAASAAAKYSLIMLQGCNPSDEALVITRTMMFTDGDV